MSIAKMGWAAARWLRHAALVVANFVACSKQRQAAKDSQLRMPPCVQYGRAVFGFYVQPTASTPASETGSHRELG